MSSNKELLVRSAIITTIILFSSTAVLQYAGSPTGSSQGAAFSSATTLPIVQVEISSGNDSSSGLQGFVVQLWRYAEGSGQATLVDQVLSQTSYVSLYDSGLPNFQHEFPNIHYSVFAFQELSNGSIANPINYHFDAAVAGSNVLKIHTLDFNVPKAAYVQTGWTASPDYCDPQLTGWVTIKTWVHANTIVGEVHSAGYMSAVFNYEVDSGTTLDVMVSYGGGWSISGSTDVQSGVDQQWQTLYYGWLPAESGFDYAEQQYRLCGIWHDDWQTIPVNYDGGAVPWSQLSWLSPDTSPGDCLTLSQIQADHVSYTPEYPNQQVKFTESNGWTYTQAIELSGAIGGMDATFYVGSTTSYDKNQYTLFTFPNNEPVYYLYSSVFGSYPVILASSAYCN